MLRKLISVCTLASLLMATVSAWCWIQSESKVGQISFECSGGDAVRVWSYDGNFIFSRSSMLQKQESGSGQLAWASTPKLANGAPPAGLTLASGFSYQSHPLKDDRGIETILILPAWLITAMFAVLPAFWIAKKIRPKSKKKPAAG